MDFFFEFGLKLCLIELLLLQKSFLGKDTLYLFVLDRKTFGNLKYFQKVILIFSEAVALKAVSDFLEVLPKKNFFW